MTRSKGVALKTHAPGDAVTCAQKDRFCWGEVRRYSFDLDLPTVALCQGHMVALVAGGPR